MDHHHTTRRALASAQAAYDAAEPDDPEPDELAEAIDAAIDELTALRARLRACANDADMQHKARTRIAAEAREIAAYLKEVTP